MTITIDIHALQTLPPSNINRDDTGAPKSAIFGGVPRQRVSSQSWKRAIRHTFEKELPPGSLGFRSKHLADLIAQQIIDVTADSTEAWDRERAADAVKQLFHVAKIKLNEGTKADESDPSGDSDANLQVNAGTTGYLLFLSPKQIENAARELVALDGTKPTKRLADRVLDSEHSIDIALFGRMVANAAQYNVDAACQVAHAIGIHSSEPEFDFYTAVDDIVEDREETGAGMLGTMQMMSSTLYRFASIDMESLAENLGDSDASVAAAVAFIHAFITSLPTGKQNSYAHNTLPELVFIAVRDTRSVSLVNAFESAIQTSDGESRRAEGAKRLAAEEREIEQAYGFVPSAAFVLGHSSLTSEFGEIATSVTLSALDEQLRGALHSKDRS